jgi:hypothetical protein
LLVISQVYGGGGNSGATFKNDFIEIFNRGTTTVDVTGWSVQYESATGPGPWSVTQLCATGPCLIAPGKYFLVQEAAGSGGTTNLPTPNATGSIAMTATAGKVALVNNTTALSGSCPSGAGILDLVGYGTTANCFEGAGPATAPGNTTADFRKSGGCVDTNNNAADFLAASPFPRNSSSPAHSCGVGAIPNLTINDVTAAEGNSGTTTFTFTVSLSSPSTGDVFFDIATQNGTATTANSDYVAKSLTSQVIPGGVQTYTFDVTVNGDTNIEPDETFLVNVTNVSGANVTDGQGVGTIQNDDLPSLSINDVSKKEGNGGPGTTTFTFTVHLSSPAPSNVTFDIATADGTAQDGNPAGEDNDYVARSVSGASISAGQQDYMFDVTVNGDTTDEPNETFFVNVTNVSGATVGDNQGQGTIQNDDGPSLSINDVTVTEGTSGTPTSAQFTVTLTGTITQTVTVNYATADDTAVAGSDYTATSGMLTFTPSGPSTQTITVQVTADSIADVLNRETFFVNLSGATNSDIGDSQGVGTIVDDEDKVVISQVYGGGGNSGATYKNDFIELFNRGTTTVTLTNYTVQYASGNSGTWNIIATLSGTLAPGQYLLIQAGPTGTNGATLSPDVVGATTNLAGTSGKVALVNGTGTLSGTCPSSASIIDFVGYGSTANVNCFEGAGPAPAPSTNNQQGVLRASGGCTDTNVNSSDFTAAAANPRNKTIIVATCP